MNIIDFKMDNGLKSDYFRIEIEIESLVKSELQELKSDYFRIEM